MLCLLEKPLLPDTASDIIPPMEFPDNSVGNIRACLDCVNATYTNAPNIRAEWDSWAQKYCPRSNSSLEYLEYLRSVQLPYHIPLKAILLHRRNVIEFPAWRDRPLERAPLNGSFISSYSFCSHFYEHDAVRESYILSLR